MNQYIFQLIHQFANRNVFADDIGIFFSDYLAYLMVLGFLILVWRENRKKMKLFLFADGALAVIFGRGIVTEMIRFFYNHPRPFAALNFIPLVPESGNSFPSGHMTFFFALAVVVWCANRKWGWWFFALATAVGIARIYTGVHWPADIFGGALIGLACGYAAHLLLKPYLEKLAAQPASANNALDS